MRATIPLAAALLAATTAQATTLLAAHPGIMCKSADALAKLTLPDGSSRTQVDNPRPEDEKIERDGGCVGVQSGVTVTLVTARHNTSIVLGTDDFGKPAQFIAPNIDFVDAAKPHSPAWPDANYPPLAGMDTLLAAVDRRCPRQGWNEHNLSHTEVGPWDKVADSLTPAQHATIRKEQRFQCTMGLFCGADIFLGMEVQMGKLNDLVRAVCSQHASAAANDDHSP